MLVSNVAPNLGRDGPRPLLPASALVAGAAVFFVSTLFLLAQPVVLTQYVGAPRFMALTHAFTLGFVTLVYAGTLQQLPAVMFVTRLVWPRLGYATLGALFVGGALLVAGFGSGMRPALLLTGGTLVSLALGASVWQLLLTARTRPPRDAASRALITAAVYLFLTVVLGLTLAAVRSRPALAGALGYPAALHQYVGLLGAFLLGIGGAGHKLLSMFALSKGGPSWRLRVMAYLVHLSILALLVGLLGTGGRASEAVALLALVAAGALQIWEVVELLRRRLRKRLEAPVKRYVIAHAFLPVAGILLLLGYREAATAAFLLGFVGLAVSGMLVKILSFLTWTAAYAAPAPRATPSPRAAPSPPPLLRDLLRPELEPVTTWGVAGGTVAAVVAMLTAWQPAALCAALLLVVGALAQVVQVLHIVIRVNQSSRPPALAGSKQPASSSGRAAS
ncbi:MAG TPA: hypothetical protein VKZ43_08190 [Trueperaceae bacterium]|nr:hypothetical protein [Trueperaceae bacterium]